jgi:hypothetical protein
MFGDKKESDTSYMDAALDGDLTAIKDKLEGAAADAVMTVVAEKKVAVIDSLNKS